MFEFQSYRWYYQAMLDHVNYRQLFVHSHWEALTSHVGYAYFTDFPINLLIITRKYTHSIHSICKLLRFWLIKMCTLAKSAWNAAFAYAKCKWPNWIIAPIWIIGFLGCMCSEKKKQIMEIIVYLFIAEGRNACSISPSCSRMRFRSMNNRPTIQPNQIHRAQLMYERPTDQPVPT